MHQQLKTRGSGTPPVERIVEAALAVIDAEGLAGLTTPRLAAELGIFQSVIYRRVASRDALLGLVVDAVMSEVGEPTADPADWRAYLTDYAERLYATWLRHPHAASLLRHGGAHPSIVRIVDGVFAGLLQLTDRPAALRAAGQAYLGYVFGTITLTTAEPSTEPPAELDADQMRAHPDFVRAQRLLATHPAASLQQAFTEGLDVVLDGIALLVGRA